LSLEKRVCLGGGRGGREEKYLSKELLCGDLKVRRVRAYMQVRERETDLYGSRGPILDAVE
jgi:hypothetical protein